MPSSRSVSSCREARPQLLFARAQDEEDSVGRHERFAVDAARRARLCSVREQEADVGDDERMHRSEGAERRGHGARASEFAQRLLRVGRADQDGRPPLAHGQPTLEQLAERAVTRGHGPREPEQGALARIDA